MILGYVQSAMKSRDFAVQTHRTMEACARAIRKSQNKNSALIERATELLTQIEQDVQSRTTIHQNLAALL